MHDLEAVSDADSESGQIRGRWPCCILWTPIPPFTWFAPFVGHMGITDSQGLLHDWGGGPIAACHPRNMMFGHPARYIQLRPKDRSAWDEAIAQADREYLEHIHCMICGLDCHSHVGRVLDILRVCGCSCHNKVALAAASSSKFTKTTRFPVFNATVVQRTLLRANARSRGRATQ